MEDYIFAMVKYLSFHKFFFFCLKIVLNVNGKATVSHTHTHPLFRFFAPRCLFSSLFKLLSAFLPSGLLSLSLSFSPSPLHNSSDTCDAQKLGELLHNFISSLPLLSRGSVSQGATVSAHLFHLFLCFSSCSCSSAAVVFHVQFGVGFEILAMNKRKRERWLLVGFGEESFRFCFSCVLR